MNDKPNMDKIHELLGGATEYTVKIEIKTKNIAPYDAAQEFIERVFEDDSESVHIIDKASRKTWIFTPGGKLVDGMPLNRECLRCGRSIPDGRVVARCDDCLALYYYHNALDALVNLLDPNTARADLTVRNQALKIVLKALRDAPGDSAERFEPDAQDFETEEAYQEAIADFYNKQCYEPDPPNVVARIVKMREIAANPTHSLNARDYLFDQATNPDRPTQAEIEKMYIDQGLGDVLNEEDPKTDQYGEPIPSDLVLLPSFEWNDPVGGSTIVNAAQEDIDIILAADWYESGGYLFAPYSQIKDAPASEDEA